MQTTITNAYDKLIETEEIKYRLKTQKEKKKETRRFLREVNSFPYLQ